MPMTGPPDAGQIRAMQKAAADFRAAQERIFTAERQQMVRFAAVLCGCQPWPLQAAGRPHWERMGEQLVPQGGCIIHGQFLIGPSGRVL